MKEEVVIECEYCHHRLKLTDMVCPKCGTSVVNPIKQYYTDKSKLIDENLERIDKITKETMNEAKKIKTSTTVLTPVNATAGFDEEANNNFYSAKIDSYIGFKYTNQIVGYSCEKNKKAKNGYSYIAFHIIVKNLTNENLFFNKFGKSISLLVDGIQYDHVVIEKTALCNCVTDDGKKLKQFKFGDYVTRNGSVDGYYGYMIPNSAKELTFNIGDYVTIIFDNPKYDGE